MMVRDGMTQPYTRLSRFHEFIVFKVAFVESIEHVGVNTLLTHTVSNILLNSTIEFF